MITNKRSAISLRWNPSKAAQKSIYVDSVSQSRRPFAALDRGRRRKLTNPGIESIQAAVNDVETASTQEDIGSNLYAGKTAAVVGAGPAGSLAAYYLSKHGFNVKVYDKRPDIREVTDVDLSKSYIIILTDPAAKQLSEVGVDLPVSVDQPKNGFYLNKGRWRLTQDGKLNEMSPNYVKIGSTRLHLTKSLVTAAASQTNIEFFFDHRCKGVDFDQRSVLFEDKDGSEVKADYDLIVAADGTRSVVRNALEGHDKDFKALAVDHWGRYVSTALSQEDLRDEKIAADLKPGSVTFHMIDIPGDKGRKDPGVFVYYKTAAGRVLCVTTSTEKAFLRMQERDQKWTQSILPECIPEEWKNEIADTIKNKKHNKLPPIIYLSRFYGDRTVIVGDAAHGMGPEAGNSCSLALMDCPALGKALREAKGDLDSVGEIYNSLRYEDAHGFVLLQEAIFPGLPHRPGLGPMLWRFMGILHLILYLFRRTVLKDKRTKEGLLRKVMHGSVNTKQSLWIIKRDALIALVLVVAVIFFLAKGILAIKAML